MCRHECQCPKFNSNILSLFSGAILCPRRVLEHLELEHELTTWDTIWHHTNVSIPWTDKAEQQSHKSSPSLPFCRTHPAEFNMDTCRATWHALNASLKHVRFRAFSSDSSIFGCGHINLWKCCCNVDSYGSFMFFHVLSNTVSTCFNLLLFVCKYITDSAERVSQPPLTLFMARGPCYS
jgi:hypothetical protein